MKNIYRLIFILFFSFPLIMGCSQETRSDSPVLARVGDSVITHDDYIREISRVPQWAKSNFKDLDGKGKFLDEMVKKELVYQYANKMRMQNDREYMDKVEEFKKMTLVTMILKKEVEEKIMLDDEMVKAFYEKNSDKFRIGTEIKASHILVKTEDEAKDVAAKLEKGSSFTELAKTLSMDKTSGQKGGDLGYFGRGKMVPEFERAVLRLKPGEVSEPVSTRFGYHIIRLDDIKEGKLASFEQSAESIKRQLAAEKQKALFDSFVDKLKAETEISKEMEALASISLPWDATEAAASKAAELPQTEEAK